MARHSWWSRLLIGVGVFNALSAFGGGIALLAGWIPNSLSMLAHSPFRSFFWPVILLVVVIGGTQTGATIALWRRLPVAPFATVVAGFGMVIWIFVELAMMRDFSPLHGVYFTTGMLQLGLAYGLLGLWPLVRQSPT